MHKYLLWGVMMKRYRSITASERTGVSGDDVRELVLYITNDGELYRGMARSIIDNMRRKRKSGKYDSALAVKGWMYLADAGVRKYDKEFGSGRGSLTMLNKATREAIAEELMEYYEDEISYVPTEASTKLRKSRNISAATESTSDLETLYYDSLSNLNKFFKGVTTFESQIGSVYGASNTAIFQEDGDSFVYAVRDLVDDNPDSVVFEYISEYLSDPVYTAIRDDAVDQYIKDRFGVYPDDIDEEYVDPGFLDEWYNDVEHDALIWAKQVAKAICKYLTDFSMEIEYCLFDSEDPGAYDVDDFYNYTIEYK